MASPLSGLERDAVLRYMAKKKPMLTLSTDGISKLVRNYNFNGRSSLKLMTDENSTVDFLGKEVLVQFYYNRLGLCFKSPLSKSLQEPCITLPEQFDRLVDKSAQAAGSAQIRLWYNDAKKSSVSMDCEPLESYTLFQKPEWNSIPQEQRVLAKKYLVEFVSESNSGAAPSIGSGLHLIPVCRYLCGGEAEGLEAVEGRAKPFSILYIDSRRVVLAKSHDSQSLELESTYRADIKIPLGTNSRFSRSIKAECTAENLYRSKTGLECYILRFTLLQKEDRRFLDSLICGQ